MTRIETFVAASFAFATTMLVISVGSIPDSMEAFVEASKNVPSFIVGAMFIFWIWHSHADWSRRYGLEDLRTVVLSGVLICIVLVYIYPLRLMMQGLFWSISGGFLPFEIEIETFWQLRFLFSFYAIGFVLLSANFFALFLHSNSQKDKLSLTKYEIYYTRKKQWQWLSSTIICTLVLIVTLLSSIQYLLYTPYLYIFISPLNVIIKKYMQRKWESKTSILALPK